MEATVVPAAPAAPQTSRTPPPAPALDPLLGTSRSRSADATFGPDPGPMAFGPLLDAALSGIAGEEPPPLVSLEIGDLRGALPVLPESERRSAFSERPDGEDGEPWAGWAGAAVPPPATPARPEPAPTVWPPPAEPCMDRVPPGASGPALRAAPLGETGRPEPPLPQGAGSARRPPGSLRESVLQARGERGRTERLWGFWLRRQAAASVGPDPVGPEDTSEEVPAATAPGAARRELPEGAHGLVKTARPGEIPVPEATREAAAGPPEGAREASGSRPQPAPSPPHQVAHAVRMAVARGGDRVTVRLEPEHLGRVEVVLAREPAGAGLTAHLRVENPQAHQALSTEMPLLRQALEARGVNLIHVQVELDDRQAGGERTGRGPAHRSRRGAGPPASRGGGEGEDLAARARPWRPWGFEALI